MGNPVYGIQKVYLGSSGENYTTYAFGTNRGDCVMTKGRVKLEEADGTVSEFYFSDSGQGYSGVKNGYLYYRGKLQKLDSGMKYDVVSIPSGTDKYENYVVSSSGKVMRSTTVKNADGIKYKTNSSGILTEIDEETAGKGHYEDPVEPNYYD